MGERTDLNNALSENNEPMDLDDLLPQVGEFGRYQKLLLFLICLPACIPCGFCAFNQLFMADVPDHWCATHALNESGLTPEQRKELTVPLEVDKNNTYSKCLRYAVNWTELLEEIDFTDFSIDSSWETEPCVEGWEYNKTEISSSIVIDFDLVCDRAIYPTFGLVALNIGGPVGVYSFGLLNDRAGRRISFFACLGTLLVGSFLTSLSTNFWYWAGSRVIVGLTIPAVYQIPFIIALELVGPNYRSFVTVMTCTFYTFGLMMLACVTYFIRDWVTLSLVTSIPFLSYFIFALFLPESPRWLLANGRLEEALKILEVLARVNKKDLPESFRTKLHLRMSMQKTQCAVKPPGPWSLCRTPNMRLKTILITLLWFANETVYLGLSYYGPSLGSNQYISFLLSSLVEIPSYFVCWLVMDRWGRRWPLCLCMIFGGILCIATVVLPADAVTETLVLFLVSKSAISASFLIIYPFAGELYPTQIRGVGIGTSSYIGGLGLICIPFITYLGTENLVLPLVIMGVVSVFGGCAGLRLPETLHHRLPQTIEEGEEFGKNYTCEECMRCIPIKPAASISGSYEDLDHLELSAMKKAEPAEEATPLDSDRFRRKSMRRLVRQTSFMDTQRDHEGAINLTYWF